MIIVEISKTVTAEINLKLDVLQPCRKSLGFVLFLDLIVLDIN